MKLAQAVKLVFMLFCCSQVIGMDMGAYDLITDQITDECGPPGEDKIHAVFEPYTEERDGKTTQLFKVNITNPFEMDDFSALDFRIDLSIKQYGFFKVIHEQNEGACAVKARFSEGLNNRIKQQAEDEKCAIPPGTFSIKGWKPVVDNETLPMLDYGTYRVRVWMMKAETTVGCVKFVGEVVRKD